MFGKVITWSIVIFIAFYLITQPTGAANVIHGLVNLLRDAGLDLATFLQSL